VLGDVITLTRKSEETPSTNLSVSVALNHGANIFSIVIGTNTATQVELMECGKDCLAKGSYEGNFDMTPIPNRMRD